VEQRGSSVRVLDFKTTDSVEAPEKKAYREIKKTTRLREEDAWQCFHLGGKTYQWLNLQLPLYAAALKAKYGRVQVGYFHVPKGAQDTRVDLWEDFDEALIEAAVGCAEEAVRRIEAGVFWPPHPKPQYDDYAEMLLGDPLASVDWSAP
jgi:hypothetical protein